MGFYYEVLPASRMYHSQKALTYQADLKLLPGNIVSLQLKNRPVLGIVKREVKAPSFTTKKIKALELPALPKTSLQLISWLQAYYPAPFGMIVQLFLNTGLLDKLEEARADFKPKLPHKANLPTLTSEQQDTLKAIKNPGTYLLHGRTGSGKTRVYQELALQTLKAGRSVILLTPEISLTSQLSSRFKQLFGNRVVVWHSHLTAKDRREIWLRILGSSEPLVVIGARSAIFSPLKNIGLIITDEAHESAYKQEQAPYYSAIRVAAKLASLSEAILILGSATPSVMDYYIAQQKQTPILTMNKLAASGQVPKLDVGVVDLKNREAFRHSRLLSDPLLAAIERALDTNEQILLFMNRRGTARVVLCSNCGWQALCPNCDVNLTYHQDEHVIRCHICGYKAAALSSCPVCKSSDILYKSVGVKALASELQSLFPKAKIQRFDSDNKKAERFESHYEAILKGNVDIIVGTQMLAKGLDLPRLSVVGVINADSGLAIPDYTAEEKTYQLITQVLGRVGRGHISGQAIIQTYLPDSPLIQTAINQNWQQFYAQEIKQRRQFVFPPFCHLLKLSCSRASSTSAAQAAERLANDIVSSKFRVQISGPAPAFHEKQTKNFHWQLVVKANQRSELLTIIKTLPSGWTYDIDPTNLL